MLAHAFLTIVAEHARAPGQARQIAITRNQIVHLDTALISHPGDDACTRCAGPNGDGVTSTAPCTPPPAASRPRTIKITIYG